MKKFTNFLIVLTAMLAMALPANALNKHVLVGYWHNFNNGAKNGLKLSECPTYWDVINLSFGEPTSSTDGNIVYNPTADNIYASEAAFSADVKAVQARGQKVLLSIGGANGQVRLESTQARDKFIETVEGICTKYGLDGLDVDFEGNSMSFAEGDYDLANPTTPVIVNLIYALNKICDDMGSSFMLTFAPETFFVQQGYSYYGTTCWGCDKRAGSFLPVLYALRNRLNWLQVQYYNSSSIPSPYGNDACGTEEFVVNLVRMLAEGFDIANQTSRLTGPTKFPALRQDQIVMGVPSTTGSAGAGVLSTDQYKSIADKLRKLGYNDLRGFMTWSINWDEHYNKSWSTPMAAYIASWNGTASDGGSDAASENSVSVTSPSAGAKLNSADSYTVKVNYSATEDLEVVVCMYDNSGTWTVIGEQKKNVSAGSGSLTFDVAVSPAPEAGTKGYIFKADIRPRNGAWDTYMAMQLIENIEINAAASGNSDGDTGSADGCAAYEQYDSNKQYNVFGEDEGKKIAYNGNVYTIVSGVWADRNCGPVGTYSNLWTLVGPCGSTGGSDGEGEGEGNGGSEESGVTNDRVLTPCMKKHVLVGYWHNFNNGAANGLKLVDANQAYDIINVSFAETDESNSAVPTFVLDNSIYASDAAFIADIKTCQARGQKVNLSIGGQNGRIEVKTDADRVKFESALIAIIEKYGFDGLDIDFEGTSAGGNSTSFKNPSDEAQLMVTALRNVCDHFGDAFILTMAPETAYVQFGIGMGYSPAYLALIYGLRDKLTILHVQLYNTGSCNDIYGNVATPGSADFLVAMCDALLCGFKNCGDDFPALAPDQVAIGVPSGTGAAGSGIVSVDEMKKALRYLTTGVKSDGMKYTMKSTPSDNFRGLMTWSINWDAANSYALANGISALYDEIGNELVNCGAVEADEEAPTAPTDLKGTATDKTIALSWTKSLDNKAVKGYNIYVNGTKVGSTSSTSYTVKDLTAETEYTIAVEAYDAAANKSSKATVKVTTLEASVEPEPEPEPEPDPADCTDPAWDSSKNYQTPGEKVSYNGKVYECLVWWTTAGQTPEAATTQWKYLYVCGGSDEGSEGGDEEESEGGSQAIDTGIDYENGMKVVAYFPNWGTYNNNHLMATVGMMPWGKITHINHAFFEVNSSYKLQSTDDFADFDKAFDHSDGWDKEERLAGHIGEYKYYKKLYPKVKVLISVGGWTRGNNFHAMAATKENRTIFINSCVEFLKKYTFIDGIDIDWEYPGVDRAADPNDSADKGCPGGSDDAANYVSMLREMRAAFDANNMSDKQITVAVSMNQNTLAKGANPGDYAQYVNLINIMSYDAHGAFERVTNHHAAIYPNPNDPSETDVEKAFNAYDATEFFKSKGVPAKKLVVGSPWYSRGWGGVTNSTNGGLFQAATGYLRGTWDDQSTPTPGGQFPWWYIKKNFENSSEWTKYFDEVSMVPYLYNESEGKFLTYEDERSLAARCGLVKKGGYAGIIIWEITGDDLNGEQTLSNIVYDELFGDTTDAIDDSEAEEYNDSFAVSLFPNPARDIVYIHSSADAQYAIVNLAGAVVMNGSLASGVNMVNVSNLNSGMYLVSVRNAGTTKVLKVLVR